MNNKILKNNLLSCNGVFIKNDIFKNFFFSENRLLSGSEDWELWLRLSKTYSFFGIKTITSGIVNHNFRSMKIQNLDKTELALNKAKQRLSEMGNLKLLKDGW